MNHPSITKSVFIGQKLVFQVFRDMLHNTIDKSCLRGKDEVLGKGGFGTVYRVKMYKVYKHWGIADVLEYNCTLIVEGE